MISQPCNFYQITVPVIMLSFFTGILFIGTVLYAYIYYNLRRRLFLAVIFFGILGMVFAGCEIFVITLGASGFVRAGMEFHRIEALSVLFFIPQCPFFLNEILNLGNRYRRVNFLFIIAGYSICLLIISAAFISPDLFLGFNKVAGPGTAPWNVSRGVPGVLYNLRDFLIVLISVYCIGSVIADIKINRQYRYLGMILAGLMIAIVLGVVDVVYATIEQPDGLFTKRVFSYFCLGVTLFIIICMITIMRFFIDQSRQIENTKKIDSLGVFAGGLAHDFNNILSGILGNVTLLIESAPDNDPRIEWMKGIEYAAYRARALTMQLLTFSKGGAPIRETASISEIVVETVNFSLSGSKVRPGFHIQDDLMNAVVDAGQISQVVQNLVLNAADATHGEAGIIDIRVENCVQRLPVNSGKNFMDCIKIEVQDYGRGIPPRELPYIFDPYFTTKDQGSGLGLAVCYSIIRKHEGDITVASKPGEGTVMTVYLPGMRGIPSAPSVKKPVRDTFSGEILVMDDDPILRTTLERMLSHIGFSVTCVTDGERAIDAVKASYQNDKPYSAVIMDLTVSGGMGGQKTAGILSGLYPELLLIVASGYSDDPVMAHYRDYGFSARLVKPISLDHLRLVMLEVLSDSGAGE